MHRLHFASGVATTLLFTFATACDPLPVDEDKGDPADSINVVDVEEILPLGSQALCRVLFSCCTTEADLAQFFAPVARAEEGSVFFDLVGRVPPNVELTEAECPALVEEIHTRKGLGPFVAAARDGLVEVDGDGLSGCLNALDSATCGAEALESLFDSTCFGLQPPVGGDEQRRIFVRSATDGDCRPITDGFGGLFFGTCDPTQAFCCVVDDSGECGIPSPSDAGVCTAAAQANETCSSFAPVLPCATGLDCILGAGPDGADGCVAPSNESLAVGSPCYDSAQFRLLGTCDNGWCDILGSDRCEPHLAAGAACTSSEQCGPDVCVDGFCGPEQRCGG
jgi:hypothetical protein